MLNSNIKMQTIMNAHLKYIYLISLIGAAALTGCSKSFSDRPPVDAITVDNFYQTTDQVQASSNILYGAPWFGYNSKVAWSISELYVGNGLTYSSDVINFGNFTVTQLGDVFHYLIVLGGTLANANVRDLDAVDVTLTGTTHTVVIRKIQDGAGNEVHTITLGGTSGGTVAPLFNGAGPVEDVYVYVIKAKSISGKPYTFTGTITLIN